MQVIATIRTDFPTKFGIPRQSGIVDTLRAKIVFEPAYRNPDALRGLEDFSHVWLIWQFSGNARRGVFATRSPFRPNPIGLSSVRIEEIQLHTEEGPVIWVSGADLMDGTPIYDIKPFIPYADNHPDARGGFTNDTSGYTLAVTFPEHLLEQVPASHREALRGVLAHDPRPSYQHDPERVYGMEFAGMEIRFRVDGEQLIVCSVAPIA